MTTEGNATAGASNTAGADGYFVEDLAAGMAASFSKTVTEADIVLFAGVSGDI